MAVDQDYFSRVPQEAGELVPAPLADGRYRPRTAIAAALNPANAPTVAAAPAPWSHPSFTPVWRPSNSVRPTALLPLPARSLNPLAPEESWAAAVLATILMTLIVLGRLSLSLLPSIAAQNTQTTFASPTLEAATRHIDVDLNNRWPQVRSFVSQRLYSIRGGAGFDALQPDHLPVSALLAALAATASAIAIFIVGRRISGTFGGLLAAIMLLTDAAIFPLPSGAAITLGASVVGMGLLAVAWQRRGPLVALAAALTLGGAAAMGHPMALLLIPLLIAAFDLPWRWSWLLPIAWAMPIAAVFEFDWHHFGHRPNDLAPRLIEALRSIQTMRPGELLHSAARTVAIEAHPAEWLLLPLAVAGIGLLFQTNRRWGLLLLAWGAPAAAIFTLTGFHIDARVIAFACPPMILAAAWLISRSALTAGLIVAVVSMLALHPLTLIPSVAPPTPAIQTPARPSIEPSMAPFFSRYFGTNVE